MTRKAYLSGPITNNPNYGLDFKYWATKIRAFLGENWQLIVPTELPHDHERTWEAYMEECLGAMDGVEILFLIPGWEASEGVKLELEKAKRDGECVIVEIYFNKKSNLV